MKIRNHNKNRLFYMLVSGVTLATVFLIICIVTVFIADTGRVNDEKNFDSNTVLFAESTILVTIVPATETTTTIKQTTKKTTTTSTTETTTTEVTTTTSEPTSAATTAEPTPVPTTTVKPTSAPTTTAAATTTAAPTTTADPTTEPATTAEAIEPTDVVSAPPAQQLAPGMLYYLPQTNITLYNGIADPRTISTVEAVDPNNIAALVNKGFALTSSFTPQGLVSVPGFTWFKLKSGASEAWQQMRAACYKEIGADLILLSGYRSYSMQVGLFDSAIRRKGIDNAVGYNALAGRSEHQLGLALDIVDRKTGKLTLSFSNTATYDWLVKNCSRFGFILRYPAHKVHITDYCFEPWHFRYVGTDLAVHLANNDFTLEEYYGLGPIAK